MNRYNALLTTSAICTLSIFSLMYTYYGTSSKEKSEPITMVEEISVLEGMPENASHGEKESKKMNRQESLESHKKDLYRNHKTLIDTNNNLIQELQSYGPTKKVEFESIIDTKTFRNIKEEIAFIKKEIRMLKKENKLIEHEIEKCKKR